MSLFNVSIEKIKEKKKHPNADRLSIYTFEGISYQCVAGLNDFEQNQSVLYLPIDSILPEAFVEKIGLRGKLAGSKANRVKTIKLRGELSQGLILPLSFIPEKFQEITKQATRTENPIEITQDFLIEITKELGIEKYDIEEGELAKQGQLHPLPEFQRFYYDIENTEKFPDIIRYLRDRPVYITEKLEGTNRSYSMDKKTGQIYINSRKRTFVGEEYDFEMNMAQKFGVIEMLKYVAENAVENCVIYGELIGPKIQGNYYGLKEKALGIFDIMVDRRFLPSVDFLEIMREFDIVYKELRDVNGKMFCVPIFAIGDTLKEFLNGKTIQEASNGDSVIQPIKLREGIVIKPMFEEIYLRLPQSRLMLKQRSPEYLSKEK